MKVEWKVVYDGGCSETGMFSTEADARAWAQIEFGRFAPEYKIVTVYTIIRSPFEPKKP